MIPRFPRQDSTPIDDGSLLTLTAQEWQDGGWDANLAYFCIDRYDWVEAETVLRLERKAVNEASNATTPEGFYAHLDALAESDAWTEVLDPGVVGLVLMLAAAGFRTSNSCSGHLTFGLPFVRLVTDPQHLQLLRHAATAVDCTLLAAEGQVEIHAQTVGHLIDLAEELQRRRAEFEQIGVVEVSGEYEDS